MRWWDGRLSRMSLVLWLPVLGCLIIAIGLGARLAIDTQITQSHRERDRLARPELTHCSTDNATYCMTDEDVIQWTMWVESERRRQCD